MDAIDSVYLGVWTNWSRGYVLGSTLTLSREQGNYVIALIAFFIAFVATRFWRIFCFIFHRSFSSPTSAQTMHRQRQIILCNSSSPESGLVSLTLLLWSWRRLGVRRLFGLVLTTLFVVVFVSGFVVAGSFSSRISSDVRNEVLLRASHCGFLVRPSDTDNGLYNTYRSQQSSAAINYAEQCYSSGRISSMVECERFLVPKLPTAVADYDAGCPFEGDICRSNSSNILLDSGYIDSREHLGVNAPDGQRRHALCPLKTEGYTNVAVVSDGVHTADNQTIVNFDYGGRVKGTQGNLTKEPYTYEAEDVDTQYRVPDGHLGRWGKVLEGSFIPRKELVRADGDTELIFLSGNGVMFDRKMADPWYQATVPSLTYAKDAVKVRIQSYIFGQAASPMGCVRQWQWCNPSLPKDRACGPLGSYNDAYRAAAPLFGLTREEAQASWDLPRDSSSPTARSPLGNALVWGFSITQSNPVWIYDFLQLARSRFLASEDRQYGNIVSGIPDDQWKQDVVKWWETIQASRQLSHVNTVRGPSEPEFEPMRWEPTNDNEKASCASQKILSTAHTSFSMFGLCFTLATGGLIILISYILDPIFECLHTRYRHKSYQHLEWRSNATLQIHRLAEEQIGFSTWEDCTAFIPTTTTSAADDSAMSSLDIADPNHPKLRRPASKTSGLPLDDLYEGNEEHKGSDMGSVASPVSTTDTVVDPRYYGVSGHYGGYEPSPVSASPYDQVSPLDAYPTGTTFGAPLDMTYMARGHS
ncbi:hypothetical protein PG984_013003 [Apiospora sp. TS-2023a]